MKTIFLGISGHAYAEDVSPYITWVQLEGGDYLVSRKSVLCDIDHNLDAIMLVRQGISAPEGDDFVMEAVHETDREKLHEKKASRSKMFSRRLFRKFINLFYFLAVLCMSISVYMLVWVFTWAWFHIWLPI